LSDEIELINDGDALAVIGDPAAVERFLVSEGLESKDLGLHRISSVLGTGAAAAQAGSEFAATSGRWAKLTEKSARALKNSPGLMKGSEVGASRAVLTENGKITRLLEITSHGSLLANPALLAGAAGLMAQLAMQQTMEEITDYLAAMDEKIDDLLRAHQDAVLADMVGVGLVIEEALAVRDQVGRVSETTWSKVQGTSMTVARTQSYALRQLDAIAEKLESKAKLGDQAKAAKEAEAVVQEWLAVLARCFQLQEATAVLELDRVLDAAPDELDRHRRGLRTARDNRLALISRSTERLISRMNDAAGLANAKVLLHPTTSREIVQASNRVTADVVDFHERLGIELDQESLEAKKWRDAAAEVRDKVLEAGADGADAAKRLGNDTFDRARSATGKLSQGIAGRALRWRGGDSPKELED